MRENKIMNTIFYVIIALCIYDALKSVTQYLLYKFFQKFYNFLDF